ncbi:DUF6083 domain-containing protein [Streptomyces longisporus]|uniref:DNA-binding phage zinc finger domain-containing protein n=1 Tax=Streptomyces longisporus TaxID=1948 RepID=A0ABN3NIW5_STRLO
MPSKYADLGTPTTCPRCGDTVRRHTDPDGVQIDLDIRDAPTRLAPEGLRWRVTGNGTAINLGWADPTDTVRVAHEDVCTARPQPDVAELLAYWRRGAARAATQAALEALQPDVSDLRRTPSRREVRTVACPQCGAVAGQPCGAPNGAARYVNHQQRVTAFHADRYRSIPGPQVGGQRRLQPPREQVRTVACPRCSAPANAPCNGARGKERTSHHFERVAAFTASC